MHRRTLLAASSLAAVPACATAQPRATSAVPLRERLAGLRLGANLERWFTVASNNQPRRLGPAWWRGFKAAGFDHARIFIPDVSQTGDGGDGNSVIGMYRQAVADAVDAGLPVLLGLSDFYGYDNAWGRREWAAFEARAALFARTDPNQVVLAPLNEPAFPDTATWLPVRERLLTTLRRAAPRHLLMWGGREWCSYRSLVETPPAADPNTIVEVHDYEGGKASDVEWRFKQVAEWRERHRQTVLVAELGGAKPHGGDRQAWAADLRQSLPVLRRLRLPANLWAYTHGGHWRLQPGEEPALYPEIRAAIA
jgi:Cellulase (glycosyl hydrolase family 5)